MEKDLENVKERVRELAVCADSLEWACRKWERGEESHFFRRTIREKVEAIKRIATPQFFQSMDKADDNVNDKQERTEI